MPARWPLRFSPADLTRAAPAAGPDAPAAVYLRIAGLLTGEIRRGRLRAGARLPATRELARMLAVNRNTVVAAYDELAGEGWITSTPASGTFVSARLPDLSPRRFAAASAPRAGVPESIGFDPAPAPAATIPEAAPPIVGNNGLFLWGGIPDLTLVPTAALARAYRRALRDRDGEALGYSDGRGHPRLRAAVAAMLSATRGLAAGADDVLITRGSQMAIDLAARTLLRPGDVVAVEELGYRRAWDALARTGARLLPLPVDADGVDVAVLAALCVRRRVRALYLTPHHQYPSTVVLSAARRIALLDLARRCRLAILEDDYDHEFHFEGRPVMPLASADAAGVVVYVGTFSKILAPGLRLGFMVAPRPLLDRVVELREVVDRQGDHATESAVAELIEDGELQRHARRMRRIYHVRRDAFVAALRRRLGGALSFRVPPGGMSLWARAARGIDADLWRARAAAHGVGFITGRDYVLPDDARAARRWRSYLRLGYGRYEPPRLEEAVRRMATALGTLPSAAPRR
ncbi:MAG TPA: PLP-dependent aminotransferase family protein [Polyangia bacterium]|nr:PLP-dependent aminotransferase family protein [Polyangia bacterium]